MSFCISNFGLLQYLIIEIFEIRYCWSFLYLTTCFICQCFYVSFTFITRGILLNEDMSVEDLTIFRPGSLIIHLLPLDFLFFVLYHCYSWKFGYYHCVIVSISVLLLSIFNIWVLLVDVSVVRIIVTVYFRVNDIVI